MQIMPSFRRAMWIQHTGGGWAHVRRGVSRESSAEASADFRLDEPGQKFGLRPSSCLSATRWDTLSAFRDLRLKGLVACFARLSTARDNRNYGKELRARDLLPDGDFGTAQIMPRGQSCEGRQRDRLCSIKVEYSKSCLAPRLMLVSIRAWDCELGIASLGLRVCNQAPGEHQGL
ncbi:uncharacterized protein M421DRAFT_417017 [Didymella exigua CBS 183.55]|uniref:Uncharacterized protein n=1 Tax=Didymella exigua CBS 183.55 TaxID=1150837 RepID=A0A6A5RXP2_9PLEO|nr:uncharacterized protein M421DRAFT_417017 [Didymella exigua CBS 183.55]KAF1932289.1 hypothetical protein M421DRAFT_417017 [Didymella exigua CBS 183.55]